MWNSGDDKKLRSISARPQCAIPTSALRLAEVGCKAGIDLRASAPRVSVHAGEPGVNVPATKARTQAARGVKCFDRPGASEVGAHSFECEV